jgi:histone deacetylase complex subunit SAP18
MAIPDLLPEPAIGTRLIFRLVYPDTRSASANVNAPGRFLSRELGSVVIGDGEGVLPLDDEEQSIVADGPMAARLGGDPEVMLRDVKFVIGDHIAVAILPPLADGSVPPPLAAGQGHGIGMGRGRGVRLADHGGSYEPYGSGGVSGGSRENGFGGFRARPRGSFGQSGAGGGPRGGGFPAGEWRRGEVLPDSPLGFRGRGGYGGGRGRDRW